MELTPDLYLELQAAAEATSKVVSQATKLIDFICLVPYDHGNQLHKVSAECSVCALERRAWLETNHPNWQVEAGERGCCSLCLERAYKFFKGV